MAQGAEVSALQGAYGSQPIHEAAANGHEVVVFQILDPRELDLDFSGETRFFDLENPEARLTTQPRHVRGEYTRLMREMIDTYRHQCAEAGIDHVLLDTETPFDVALGRYLVRRKRLG